MFHFKFIVAVCVLCFFFTAPWVSLQSVILSFSGRTDLSHNIRFPTMWHVRPAKAQTSLTICAVLSEPLLVA